MASHGGWLTGFEGDAVDSGPQPAHLFIRAGEEWLSFRSSTPRSTSPRAFGDGFLLDRAGYQRDTSDDAGHEEDGSQVLTGRNQRETSEFLPRRSQMEALRLICGRRRFEAQLRRRFFHAG